MKTPLAGRTLDHFGVRAPFVSLSPRRNSLQHRDEVVHVAALDEPPVREPRVPEAAALGVSAIRDAYPKVRIISTRGTEAGLLGPASFDVGYSPNP